LCFCEAGFNTEINHQSITKLKISIKPDSAAKPRLNLDQEIRL